jgi:hypothetical protein
LGGGGGGDGGRGCGWIITGGGGGGISIDAIVLASRLSITTGGGCGARGVEGGDGLSLGSGVPTLRWGTEGKGRSRSSCGVTLRGVVGSLSDEISWPKVLKIFFSKFNIYSK